MDKYVQQKEKRAQQEVKIEDSHRHSEEIGWAGRFAGAFPPVFTQKVDEYYRNKKRREDFKKRLEKYDFVDEDEWW